MDDDAVGSGTATFAGARLIEGPRVMVDGALTQTLCLEGKEEQGVAASSDDGRQVTLTGDA